MDLGQLLDRWAIGLDTLMAGHTIRDSGDLHLTVGSGGLMARVAFHSCLNMLLVTERDRLRNRFNGPADVLGFASRTRRNRSRLSLRSHSCRTLSFREQSVSRQDSWGRGVRIEISTRPHRNHHKLLSGFLPQIRHGCGVRVGFELVDPELFSRPRIERPEAVIVGAPDEDQSSRGGYGTSEAVNTGLGNPFCFQIIHDLQRRPAKARAAKQVSRIIARPGGVGGVTVK